LTSPGLKLTESVILSLKCSLPSMYLAREAALFMSMKMLDADELVPVGL
jgi:hypothetical protein